MCRFSALRESPLLAFRVAPQQPARLEPDLMLLLLGGKGIKGDFEHIPSGAGSPRVTQEQQGPLRKARGEAVSFNGKGQGSCALPRRRR